MAYKHLVVHVDDSSGCDVRMRAAIELAQRFDAHVTALYLIPEIILPIAAESYLGADIHTSIEKQEQDRAETVLEHFRKAASAENVAYTTRTDHRAIVDFPKRLEVHGRYADLLVLGQQDPTEQFPSEPSPGDVVLNVATPVLVVPLIGFKSGFGKRPMIAWNASREAARSVKYAMPFLEQAETVNVVTFNPKESEDGHGELPGADIALYLTRHGIDVDVQRLHGKDTDVGNALLSHTFDRDSDLLVMGCYGHSRLREWVFGGATRTILQSMTLPLIMGH